MKRINIFIDMDGVLAEYDEKTMANCMDSQYYFLNRPLMQANRDFFQELADKNHKRGYLPFNLKKREVNFFVLSTVRPTEWAETEKAKWLHKHNINLHNPSFFVPSGINKKAYLKANFPKLVNGALNILIDDFTPNCLNWCANENVENFQAIKMMNGCNGRFGKWKTTKRPTMNHLDTHQAKLKEIEKCVKLADKFEIPQVMNRLLNVSIYGMGLLSLFGIGYLLAFVFPQL